MASPFPSLHVSDRRRAITWGVVGAAGMTELAVLLAAPRAWWPKCPIHATTGLFCPGCGGQRAVRALLDGHFELALRCNALLFAVPLFFLALHVVTRSPWGAAGRRTLLVVAALSVIGYTVLRNLPGSGFAPPG